MFEQDTEVPMQAQQELDNQQESQAQAQAQDVESTPAVESNPFSEYLALLQAQAQPAVAQSVQPIKEQAIVKTELQESEERMRDIGQIAQDFRVNPAVKKAVIERFNASNLAPEVAEAYVMSALQMEYMKAESKVNQLRYREEIAELRRLAIEEPQANRQAEEFINSLAALPGITAPVAQIAKSIYDSHFPNLGHDGAMKAMHALLNSTGLVNRGASAQQAQRAPAETPQSQVVAKQAMSAQGVSPGPKPHNYKDVLRAHLGSFYDG